MSVVLWRKARPDDLPAMDAIAALVHPGFPEDAAVAAERLALYPAGIHVLEGNGAIAGYLVSHPGRFDRLPPLNTLLGTLPAEPDMFYLHDLALLPVMRGTGAAGALVEQVAADARMEGFPCLALVAVNGSIPFWTRMGFVVRDLPELAEKLASYEAAARLMVRPLDA
jgi:GNAT superfamily N-acetyltransferase